MKTGKEFVYTDPEGIKEYSYQCPHCLEYCPTPIKKKRVNCWNCNHQFKTRRE